MRRSHGYFLSPLCWVALYLALLLPGCTESRYVAVEYAEDSGGQTYAYADASSAFDACMARCDEGNPLGFLTREGCFKGCFEARRQVYKNGSVFSSGSDCYAAMEGLELNRDLYVENARAWCDGEYTHLHKLQGCRDAMAVFYSALTPENMCGGSSTPAVAAPSAAPSGAHPATVTAQPLPKGTYTTPPDALPPAYTPVTITPSPVDTPKYQAPPTRRPAPSAPATAVAPKPAKSAPVPGPEKDTPMRDAPAPSVSPEEAEAEAMRKSLAQ